MNLDSIMIDEFCIVVIGRHLEIMSITIVL